MSHPSVSSEELFSTIASNSSTNETKLDLILQLKTHVKKDFVDIKQVPQYFEALSIAVDIHDLGISSNSFSVLCHLVKRVSMQDKSGKILNSQSYLVLPILISRMGDSKASTRSSSKKALEAFWFSTPKQVEDAIADIALRHRNSSINLEAVHWLNHLVTNVNQHFKLTPFLPHLINLLNNNDPQVIHSVQELLSNYYGMKHNRLYKFDLARELEMQNVPLPIANSLMNSISGVQAQFHPTPASEHHHQFSSETTVQPVSKFVTAVNARTTTTIPQKEPEYTPKISQATTLTQDSVDHVMKETFESENTESEATPMSDTSTLSDTSSLDADLQKILATVKYTLDQSITPINFRSAEQLSNAVNELLPPFGNKETEFNWSTREKNIIKLRSIVRGNASVEHRESLINGLRDSSEGICKSVSSLRTTLSAHGCQLVKEAAIILGTHFDILVDYFMPHLLKLCSATKHIASTNANMTICAIFANCAFNSRLMTKVSNAANDKNVSPRNYSGIWMQIMILRFSNNSYFLSAHGPMPSGTEVCCKIIPKLLVDPNPAVRQVAKDSFWCFWGKFPTEAENLLTKLDPKVAKGIERSRPSDSKVATAVVQPKKPRLSLKETIMERNRELRRKEAAAGGNGSSRPSSRAGVENERHYAHHTASSLASSSTAAHGAHSNSSSTASGFETGRASRVPGAQRIVSNPTTLKSRLSNLDISKGLTSDSNYIPATTNRRVASSSRTREDLKPQETNPLVDSPLQSTPSPKDHGSRVNDLLSVNNTAGKVSAQSFDIQRDPILKFLSSNQTDLITEGINLLKYAILGEEELSSELNGLLRTISIREPALLKPFFLSTDNLFKKSYQFFSPDDFFRICSILIDPIREHNVDLIISVVDLNQIYDSITKLLSYTISTSNILDNDDELTIQMIRYKSSIIRMIVDFLRKGLDKIPISDSYFSKLTSHLFELNSLLRSTEVYASFTDLMRKLYSINPALFVNELGLQDQSTKEDVEEVIGIDKTSAKVMSGTSSQLGPWSDLTKVNPIGNFNNLSPVKLNTDFTMIVPLMKDNDEFTQVRASQPQEAEPVVGPQVIDINLEPEFKTVEENLDFEDESLEQVHLGENDAMELEEDKLDFEMISGDAIVEDELTKSVSPVSPSLERENQHPQSQEDNSNLVTPNGKHAKEKSRESITSFGDASEKDNVFVDSKDINKRNSNTRSELFSRFETTANADHSSELVDDFAQVKITELGPNGYKADDPIQSFIDKVDPLKSVSSKNKPITIYEDATGSPQKVRDYNYSDVNWFNYQIAKLSIDNNSTSSEKVTEEQEFSIDAFNSICREIQYSEVSSQNFMNMLNYLQNLDSCDLEFHKYFENVGKDLLASSIWEFFGNPEKSSQTSLLSGVILLKQLLINRCNINFSRIWNTLMALSEVNDPSNANTGEFSLALGETFDETLSGVYGTREILETILQSLGDPAFTDPAVIKSNQQPLIFNLYSLSKVLGMNSIALLINDALIAQIDSFLFRFINSDKVEIRRCAIQSYSKLLSASRASHSADSNRGNNPLEQNGMNGIMQKFSITQKKLVEYYSQS